MSHPVVHAEIRSSDPDATRAFGVPGALYTAIGPLQDGNDLVTFFVGVTDMDGAIADAVRLGGSVVQQPQKVPGVTFAVIADPLGHQVGLARQD